MVPVVGSVIGNETMSVTLQFRIDHAAPPVMLSGLRGFYSATASNNISDPNVMEITNLRNRTTESRLVVSFSSDGLFFNLTVENIVQARVEGEETDAGRYFLQATNPAGVSIAFIDLIVYGKQNNIL